MLSAQTPSRAHISSRPHRAKQPPALRLAPLAQRPEAASRPLSEDRSDETKRTFLPPRFVSLRSLSVLKPPLAR
ncbi:hypothetical protein [Microbacterium sp. P04]|uniref:hypothetical protein n=1 Tax=Microbacterium sp. P04 TaxID=3366947 RepID=UPI003746BBFF